MQFAWAVTSGNRFIGVDGFPWEWSDKLPTLAFYQDGALVADLRLRRDAGMLCVFADVQDAAAFGGGGQEAAESSGHGEGVELFFGPMEPATREVPGPGDTAVLLSAEWKGDQLVGIVQAWRPASEPLAPSPFLRPLSAWGTFHGDPPKKPVDFRTGPAEVPGASVTVRPWLDGRGYSLEAEIPLALFPEIVAPTRVNIKRQMNVNQNPQRLDLAGPFRFNAVVRTRGGNGGTSRLSWMPEASGAMRPSGWGVANLPGDAQPARSSAKGDAR